MTRFLHTADWQIGHQYNQFSAEDSAAIWQARLDAVATIAKLATENAVDAILVEAFDKRVRLA